MSRPVSSTLKTDPSPPGGTRCEGRPCPCSRAGESIDGDFTACSVDVLNMFYAAYRNAHS